MESVSAYPAHSRVHNDADDVSEPVAKRKRSQELWTQEQWKVKVAFQSARNPMRLMQNAEMILRFTNTTRLPVDLVWCDYFDDIVFYAPIQPGCNLRVLCSRHHNWEVLASDGTHCLLNCQETLKCSTLGPMTRDVAVDITMPLMPLRDAMVQYVNRILPGIRSVYELPLPVELKGDMVMRRIVCRPEAYYAFDNGSGTVQKDYSNLAMPPQIVYDDVPNKYFNDEALY